MAWVTVLLLALPGEAVAHWLAGGSGNARAKADALGAGATPTTSVTGRNVQVSWTGTTFHDGSPADGYVIRRYTNAGAVQTILDACTGTIAGLTCTEHAVPAGTWRYGVTPVQGSTWDGPEGTRSTAITMAAPSFSFDSAATVTSLPAPRTGTLAQFATGESVTFHLDSPTGTVLTGGHSAIGAGGTATTSTTLPAGTAQGLHTIYAVGSLGSQTSAQLTVDTVAPAVSAAAIVKSAGGLPGFLVQGGTYYVYANVSDATTGVASVTANVSTVTTGLTATPLSAGSWTVGGVTYTHRSGLLTAIGTLAPGAKAFSIGASDVAGNAGTATGFSVTVDNTAPDSSDVQISNGGSTVGKPETGDVVAFTYTETMDPASIMAGWSGAATSVTVQVQQAGGSDHLEVFDAAGTTLLALGQIRLNRTDFVTTTVSFTGSTMTQSGATIQIVLGTPSGATGTAAGTATLRWSTSTAATDRAGNACAGGNLNEPGGVDTDF